MHTTNQVMGPVLSSSALSEDADDDDRVNVKLCFFELDELERRLREPSSSSLSPFSALLEAMCNKGQRKRKETRERKMENGNAEEKS